MLKAKNILAGLGAFAGLGIAIMPLTSVSAAEGDYTDDVAAGATSDAHEVKAQIGEVISIEVTDEDYDDSSDMITLGAGTVADNFLTHEITVKGNTKHDYALAISAGTSGTAMIHENQSAVTIPTGTTLSESVSAWGYKYAATKAGLDNVSAWSAVPANFTDLKSASTTDNTNNYDDTHYVRYGVSAAPDQLSGIYTAEVIYKAYATAGI